MRGGPYATRSGRQMKEGTEKYNTPLTVVGPIADAVGGFGLDPCASTDSELADTNYRHVGGLTKTWNGFETVFCNHPFDDPGPWLTRAKLCDARTVVTISKADPSSGWFHDHLREASAACFPRGRLAFVGFNTGVPFPVVFGVWGEVPAALARHLDGLGWLVDLTGGLPVAVDEPDVHFAATR